MNLQMLTNCSYLFKYSMFKKNQARPNMSMKLNLFQSGDVAQ